VVVSFGTKTILSASLFETYIKQRIWCKGYLLQPHVWLAVINWLFAATLERKPFECHLRKCQMLIATTLLEMLHMSTQCLPWWEPDSGWYK
jgi:hypothetical protein